MKSLTSYHHTMKVFSKVLHTVIKMGVMIWSRKHLMFIQMKQRLQEVQEEEKKGEEVEAEEEVKAEEEEEEDQKEAIRNNKNKRTFYRITLLRKISIAGKL